MTQRFRSAKKAQHGILYSVLLTSFPILGNTQANDKLPGLLHLSMQELMNLSVEVASNFSEKKLESGASIEVINKAQWQSYGSKSVTDAISSFPAIMTHQVPWGGQGIAIRGFSSSSSVGGIATTLDGIPLNNIFTGSALYEIRSINLPALNKIELIKGPGSSLYGSDAFHGVLSLQSYSSEQEQTAVNYSLTNNHFKQFNINHTQKWEGNYKLDASFSGTKQSPQNTPFSFTAPASAQVLTSERNDAYDTYTGIIKLKIKHDEDITTSVGIYALGSESDETVGPGQSQSSLGSVFGSQDKTMGEDERIAVKADLTWQLDNHLILEGNTYFWHLEREAITDVTPIGLSGIFATQRQDKRSVEVKLKQTENSWQTQWAFGVGYNKAKLLNSDVALTVGLTEQKLTPDIPQQESGYKRDVKSAFFESKTKLFDEKLTVQTGFRLDHYRAFGDQLSPRLGFIYAPSNHSAFKLLYGEAFKAPTAGESSGGGSTLANPDLKPEQIKTTELVYMYNKNTSYVNFTLFKSNWTDAITLVPSGDPLLPSIWENIGDNKSTGVELTYRGNIDHWHWDLSASYVDSKAETSRGDIDYVAFPKQIYNINFGYHFPKQQLELFVINRIHRKTKAGPILLSTIPNSPDFVPNPSTLKTYWHTDLTLTYQGSNYTAQLAVANLFNRDNFLPSVWNSEFGLATTGRHIGLSFSFNF